jgi:bifunctional ADP-heptose synthase (sugar kinase/adenylyltransferase)
MFDAVKDFKVLLVGDGIVDEYCYVTPLGKSIKDNMISVKYHRKESFSGGVWAAAAHVREFCSSVDVMYGPNITTNRRYVEEGYLRKLFVVHETKPMAYSAKKDFGDYDLVIVTDFGHGCITKDLIEKLTLESRYLCVNTQTNTSNFGFNVITKFPRADFVVLDELEARLATHDRHSPIEDVILELGFKKIIVTMGSNGAIGYDGEFYKASALTTEVRDTMGAGDAFLSVASPFAKAGFPMKELLHIGNAAGAVKVGIVGQGPVTKEALECYL